MAIIGPMFGETIVPTNQISIAPKTPMIGGGVNSQFIGSGNAVNNTPVAPGSYVIRNDNSGSTGANVGALSLGDVTNGIIGQLAKFAMANGRPGATNVGGGFNNMIQSPTPSGIGGNAIKIF